MGKRAVIHCADNTGDRALGEYWERQFGVMVVKLRKDKLFTPHQWNKRGAAVAYGLRKVMLLPDVTVWSFPGEHHEIKHKNPTPGGYFGLEEYRIEALCEFARNVAGDVLYTIHDWSLLGDRDDKRNRPADWATARVMELINSIDKQGVGPTYCNGTRTERNIYYWHKRRFTALMDFWGQLDLFFAAGARHAS